LVPDFGGGGFRGYFEDRDFKGVGI
jgi:hypothetical protein